MSQTEKSTVVVSGIRATGRMHIGNYIGALRHFVPLAKEPANDCYYFVADLHTLTTKTNPTDILRDRQEIVLDFLAAGLEPDDATIYCQSSIPELTELSWILACITPVSKLESMHHWKEKKDKLESLGRSANAGLLTYPILMTADIIGVKANLVPVGDDQKAHVELAREICRSFNNEFGYLFPEPETKSYTDTRIPGLQAGGKMGKSESGEGTIYLSDSPAQAWKKFRAAVTDPKRIRRNDPGSPEICNIFTFHQILSTGEEIALVQKGCRNGEMGCVDCKSTAFRHINDLLEQLQGRRAEFVAKGPQFVEEMLHEGGKKARRRIAETVNRVKEMVGIRAY